MSLTLAQLLTPETQATIRARLVTNLLAAGFPVADWSPSASGGSENIWLDVLSDHLAQYVGGLQTTIASMMFLDKASGDGLTFYAEHFYQLERDPATKTRMTIRLSSTTDAPPYTIAAGDIWVAGLTGNRYVSITGGELPPGGVLFITVEAEFAGSVYADADSSIDSTVNAGAMITPLPGVFALNVPAQHITTPLLVGSSAGKLGADWRQPFRPAFDTMRVEITTSGNIGSGAWRWTIDNGVTWTSGGPMAATVDLVPLQVRLTFANAPGVSPSFLAGDQWSFSNASATIAQGDDEESDELLKGRCRSRWPSLADVPVAGKIGLWAQLASPEVGQYLADADFSVPGQVDLVIAGDHGPVGAETAALVQNFIQPRLLGYQGLSIAEKIVVTPAVTHPVVVTGVVLAPRGSVVTVQTAALTNWLAYLRTVRIGGVVELSELVQAIMDAGAIAVQTPVLVGGAPNILLGRTEVAVPPSDGTSIITSMGWVPT